MSQLSFDESLLPKLEALYRTRDVLRRRQLVRDALAVKAGDHVLDVGCGPGFYAGGALRGGRPDGQGRGRRRKHRDARCRGPSRCERYEQAYVPVGQT